MYFLIGWPKLLKLQQSNRASFNYIISNRDRGLFAVLTDDTISIWYCKPAVQLICYTNPHEHADEVGRLCKAEWKPDSSHIVVTTSKHYVLFYQVDLDTTVSQNSHLYSQNHQSKRTSLPHSSYHNTSHSIPAIKLTFINQICVSSTIMGLITLRDVLCLSLANGQLCCVLWDGHIDWDFTINVTKISLSSDLQHSRVSYLSDDTLYVKSMDFSPMLGGYALVLSNCQAIFLLSPSSHFEKEPHGLLVPDLCDASTVAINQKYRLIAFGCQSGEGVVYCVDDVVGSLCVSHRLTISSKDYPDACHVVGCVTNMRWTPDGSAIALSWQNGGFALWSVFGALLVCTLRTDYSFSDNQPGLLYPPPIKSMEWGVDGYHLWVLCNDSRPAIQATDTNKHILLFSFVKSALTVNPCMPNHEHLFLQGEDTLYLNSGSSVIKAEPSSNVENVCGKNSVNVLISNKQWQLIPVSFSYLYNNWPIRYSAIDREGSCVAIAGRTGLAHYAMFSRKWKLFGNETQEKEMVVTGGLTWWKDFICTACFNITDQKDELRFYPRSSKLDNTYAFIIRLTCQVLLVNTFRSILIVFSADSHVSLYILERKATQPNVTLLINKLQEVSLVNYIPHPICVVGVSLTSLRTDSGVSSKEELFLAESILVNVSGKLLMFQRDKKAPQVQTKKNENFRPVPFSSPLVVATCVENMWTTAKANNGKTQLMEALWLCCGAQGMKVWLPLNPQSDWKTHNFMSRRIMLHFKLDIYPLAVLFEDVVILGAASDLCAPETRSPFCSSILPASIPYSVLERTIQVYLHHILRQLLRRNLGVHALDIASCCTELPYFTHILELLLHEVLEVEATTKDPIPDPLLPRVSAFIQEFPQFLQTVVHCARKTEVALWPYLFMTVGNPKDLFEECLINENLETASSYLIILQNLEKPIVSRQHATLLLDATLEQGYWQLSRDIVRFLKAIDPSEGELPMNLLPMRSSSLKSYPAKYPSPPMSPEENSIFQYSINRIRSPSGSFIEGEVERNKERVRQTKSGDCHPPIRRMSSRQKDDGSVEEFYIDVILCRHARKLLTNQKLRDLAQFAANMDDFELVAWLRKERLRAAKVEDFVTALQSLHNQFHWPKPLARLSANQLKINAASETVTESIAINSDTLQENDLPPPITPLNSTAVNLHNANNQQTSSFDINQSCPTLASHSGQVDVYLQQAFTETVSMATIEPSETGSFPGDSDYVASDCSYMCNDVPVPDELEQLSHELANHGSTQSELELRYLLQIMLEAGCLEWAVLISLLLRDALAVVRIVNTASMTATPLEVVGRLREGVSYIQHWVDTECMGYKSFMLKIVPQISILEKVAEQAPAKSVISGTNHILTNMSDNTPLDLETSLKSSLTITDTYKCNGIQDQKPESNGKSECIIS